MSKPPRETFDAVLPDDTITLLEIDGFIGALAMEFNQIEVQLQGVLATALGTDGIGAAAVWNAVMWNKRLEMIDVLIRNRPQFEPLTLYWGRVYEFLREIGGDRNFIIHGSRMQHHRLDGAVEQSVTFNDFPNYDMARRTDEVSLEELKEIILDARAASHALATLHLSMRGRGPSPDTLASTALRRRPPRHLRKTKSI